jgi:predicted nucleic acid-binding protein
MGSGLRAYLDSSAVLDLIDTGSLRHDRAKNVLATEPRTWCTSDLVRLECLVRPLREKNDAAESAVKEVLGQMESLPLTTPVFDLAASFRAEQGLRTPDAIHLAAAIISS